LKKKKVEVKRSKGGALSDRTFSLNFSSSLPFRPKSRTWSLLGHAFDQALEDFLCHQRAVDEAVGHPSFVFIFWFCFFFDLRLIDDDEE
jgi:hypothetical protein